MIPEISILIVTHNQRLLLERCLDSVLKQVINVPYEIIVSDDGLADGTEEYVKSLSVSERVSKNKNLLRLSWVRCNSEDCSPVITGHRIGWNKLTAYKHASGKYFVMVDADDFLFGTDLYQKEYEMLEAHPECSMVQSRLLNMDEDADCSQLMDGFPISEKLINGAVFSLDHVLRYGLIGLNQTYMIKRRPQDDMDRVLGRRFNDINITFYHLQYGPVVFLDTTGYVWVQYTKSTSHSLNSDEMMIAYGLIPLSLAMLFENSRLVFLGLGVRKLRGTINNAPRYPKLSDNLRLWFSTLGSFIYRFYSEHRHSIGSWSRYWVIWLLLLMMWRLKLNSKFWLDLLYRAMV